MIKNQPLESIVIPYDIAYDPYLGNCLKALYGTIFSLCERDEENKCLASNKYLSFMLLVTPQTISNGISELVKNGFLFVTHEVEFMTSARVRVIRINMDKLPSLHDKELKKLPIDKLLDYFASKGIEKYKGIIYFLLADNGLTKIGFSRHLLDKRKTPIDRSLPYDTKLITQIEVHKPKMMEELLHDLFKDKKVRGEWFRLSPADLFRVRKRRFPETIKRLMI